MTDLAPHRPLTLALTRGLRLWAALMVFAAVYRVRLALLSPLWAPEVAAAEVWKLVSRGAWTDVLQSLSLFALLLPLGLLPKWWWRALGGGLTTLLLLVVGLISATHLRLLGAMHAGLSWPTLLLSFESGEWWSLRDNILWPDLLLAAAPLLAWLALARVSWQRTLTGALWVGAIGMLLIWLPGRPVAELAPETTVAPVWYTASTWASEREEPEPLPPAPLLAAAPIAVLAGAETDTVADAPGDDTVTGAKPAEAPSEVTPGLFLHDPRVTDPAPVAKVLPPPRHWNVVWIVLESTGLRYFKGEASKGKLPMPYAHKLATEGWFLTRHHSPSNSSATSIVAQFSGLYPLPSVQMFSVAPDNYLPSLFSWLPADYERFLYTAGRLTYFFPKAFMQHGGMTDMVGYDETTVTRNPGGEGLSKDEVQVVGTFVERLGKAHEPFAAVYYSYLGHWPYTDYSLFYPAEGRHFGGARLIDHYLDNLWLLDKQIERIVEQLRKQGVLDRTIIVVAGDHGEAFGQHEHSWAHAKHSWQENHEAAAFLWQPAVFPPREVTELTLHTDLMPTVLDALGVPYDAEMVQGESLFQQRMRRKVAFLWGNQGVVTGSFADGQKLLWSVRDRSCTAYDLATDPLEKKAIKCPPERLDILRAYKDFQLKSLPAWSEARRKQEPWQGHAPPK